MARKKQNETPVEVMPVEEPVVIEQEKKVITAVVSCPLLNIRKDANKNSSVLDVAHEGTIVEVVSTDVEWSKIKHGNITGYMMNSFLSFNE